MKGVVNIREKRVLSVKEVSLLLGEQVVRDARAAGWLKPCVVKLNDRTPRPFFGMGDVRAVEDRILSGEYPGQKRGAGL